MTATKGYKIPMTTIAVDLEVRAELSKLLKYPRESYNDALRRTLGLKGEIETP